MAIDRDKPPQGRNVQLKPETSNTGASKEKVRVRFTRGMIVATCIEAAGFRGDANMLLMLAVSYGESTWNFEASGGGGDWVGLFQINRKAHAKLMQDYDWKNPLDNCLMARKIYDMQGIKAWGAYTDGAYKRPAAQNAARTALAEYKMLTKDHRLIILDAYRKGTSVTRGVGFATNLIPAVGKAVTGEVADSLVPDNLGGFLKGFGTQLGGIVSNALVVIIAVVLLVLGVWLLIKTKGGKR